MEQPWLYKINEELDERNRKEKGVFEEIVRTSQWFFHFFKSLKYYAISSVLCGFFSLQVLTVTILYCRAI